MGDDFILRGRHKLADVGRVAAMLVCGFLVLHFSTAWAVALGEPALAPWGMWTGLAIMSAGVSHVLRRLFFPRLDLQQLAFLAARDKQAGHVVLGVCLVLAALVLTMGSAKAAEIPPGAVKYLPVLVDEQRAYWPGMSDVAVLAGQVEQESCVSLKSSRCWSPRAELRTDRERGVGMGQITRTARMDALTEMRQQYPVALRGWSWNSPSLYDPVLQLRAMVLMDHRNYRSIVGAADEREHIAMMLASYNGGLGRVISDRRMCQVTPGCDPSRWFGHAERTSRLPKVARHGYGKSFFAINREYPRSIMFTRRLRYVSALGDA